MKKLNIGKAKTMSLGNFACFQCRKTFSRPYKHGIWTRICPTCRGTELYMGPKWESPKTSDEVKWKIIELFVKSQNGLVLWDENLEKIPFPKSLAKAKTIVAQMHLAKTKWMIEIRKDEAKKIKGIKKNEKSISKSEKIKSKMNRTTKSGSV